MDKHSDWKDILVDAGGYRLNARLRGAGEPSIVFEAGMGDDLLSWYKIQPVIAKQASTLAYDRAGLGESETSPHRRHIPCMVEDLHTLLAGVELPPPYVIVAHSLGGYIARMFADRYPSLVGGLVLVDPAHEEFAKGMRALRSKQQWEASEKRALARMRQAPAGVLAEYKQREKNNKLMAGVQWRSEIPTTILTSIRFDGDIRRMGMLPEDKLLWRQLHEGWLKHLPHAKHILTEGSGHYIHVEEPELVIEAIREMIAQLDASGVVTDDQ